MVNNRSPDVANVIELICVLAIDKVVVVFPLWINWSVLYVSLYLSLRVSLIIGDSYLRIKFFPVLQLTLPIVKCPVKRFNDVIARVC